MVVVVVVVVVVVCVSGVQCDRQSWGGVVASCRECVGFARLLRVCRCL